MPDAPIGIYRLERWRASLRYYVERPVVRLETPEDVLAFVSADRPVYVVLMRQEYETLRQGARRSARSCDTARWPAPAAKGSGGSGGAT